MKDLSSVYNYLTDAIKELCWLSSFFSVRLLSFSYFLQKHYSEFCLFFYDFYGGNFIGVVLKPDAKLPKEFKVRFGTSVHSLGFIRKYTYSWFDIYSSQISNLKCAVLRNNKLALNVEAMMDDFRILGSGIVTHVESTENKWPLFFTFLGSLLKLYLPGQVTLKKSALILIIVISNFELVSRSCAYIDYVIMFSFQC